MRIIVKKQDVERKLARINRRLKTVPRKSYEFFKDKTPIDSGNAKKSTKLIKPATINANYPYADRLDNGWSRQAPFGMSLPTMLYIKSLVKKVMLRS